MSTSVQQENQESSSATRAIFRINKEMLPCKIIFFLHNAGFRCLFTFKALFYLSFGMEVDRLGLSSFIVGICEVLWFPFWGATIDCIGKGRQLFITAIVIITTFSYFSIPWLVQAIAETEQVVICKNGTMNKTSLQFSSNSSCSTAVKLLNPDTFFYTVTVIGIICSIPQIGEISYRDAAVIKTTYTRKKPQNIGEQRVLAPFGMALGTLIAGFAIDHYRPQHQSPYAVTFYIYVPLSFLGLPVLWAITKQADWKYGTHRSTTNKAMTIAKDMVSVVGKLDNLVFLASIFVFGYCADTFSHFLYIYMHHTMHPSKTIMATSSVVGTLCEMVALKLSMWLIKVFGGRLRCISLVIFITSFRLLMLSFCTSPLHVVLLQPLSGIERALGTTAILEHIWIIFPKSVTTSGLSIFHILHWIVPSPLVNAVGGQVYHKFGGVKLFRGVSLVAFVWCLITIAVFRNDSRGTIVGAVCENKDENDINSVE